MALQFMLLKREKESGRRDIRLGWWSGLLEGDRVGRKLRVRRGK